MALFGELCAQQSLYFSGCGEEGEADGEELYAGKSDEQLRNGGGGGSGGGGVADDARRRHPGGGNGIEILTAGRRAGAERARAARWAR